METLYSYKDWKSFVYVYPLPSPQINGKLHAYHRWRKKANSLLLQWGKKSFKDSLCLFLNGLSQAAKSSIRFDSYVHECQSQKATLTCAPGIKQNVLKTFYFLIGVTRPFRPQIPLDLHTHFLHTEVALLCSNNIIMKSNNSVPAPQRNLVCISNKFPQNKSVFWWNKITIPTSYPERTAFTT